MVLMCLVLMSVSPDHRYRNICQHRALGDQAWFLFQAGMVPPPPPPPPSSFLLLGTGTQLLLSELSKNRDTHAIRLQQPQVRASRWCFCEL